MSPVKDQHALSVIHDLDRSVPVNLVLSGGGAKGVAHIAFIEFLEKEGFTIQSISATSAGALVGALYASGLRPPEILKFFKTTPIFRYTWLYPAKAGIFDTSKYELAIKNFVKAEFENLNIPLTITATNIEKGIPVYFSKGKLIPGLLASCAVPAVFSPIEIDGELYSDGGVVDNFPVAPFENSDFPIIGSYVCKPSAKNKYELNSIFKVTNHANSLLLFSANKPKFKETRATVVFTLGNYGTFDTKKIHEIYQLAQNYLEEKP